MLHQSKIIRTLDQSVMGSDLLFILAVSKGETVYKMERRIRLALFFRLDGYQLNYAFHIAAIHRIKLILQQTYVLNIMEGFALNQDPFSLRCETSQ